ncbi:DUF2062 domain-containing protein [Eleftheria terrae]|uniref:DUF2062 domain-containing protein n=1 Tax=Eleftheria terrae TaxID=1597781 RepID=UPI00263AF28A|nr:DUF2062 domain-containing protein [Eleftheria terrae]WKB51512.1 DUF2062 domain-containing protein [Eleftheria terrae]
MTSMKDMLARRLKDQLPRRDDLARNRWLRPIAAHVLAPELWRMRGEAVARGVAVGTFWAFVVPVAQIVFATAHCVWWRANIPVAAAITFITNPLTVGGWLWLAYQVGSLVVQAPPPQLPGADAGAWGLLQSVGLPALVGMGLFATVGAGLGYLGVKLAWRLRLARRLKARAQQRAR